MRIPTLSIPEFEKLDNVKSINPYLPRKLVDPRGLFSVNGPRFLLPWRLAKPMIFGMVMVAPT
jgi:hypothetical protein